MLSSVVRPSPFYDNSFKGSGPDLIGVYFLNKGKSGWNKSLLIKCWNWFSFFFELLMFEVSSERFFFSLFGSSVFFIEGIPAFGEFVQKMSTLKRFWKKLNCSAKKKSWARTGLKKVIFLQVEIWWVAVNGCLVRVKGSKPDLSSELPKQCSKGFLCLFF